ncbi:MAG: dockerin type I domain-containing protein [Phycisphaerales bacterium]
MTRSHRSALSIASLLIVASLAPLASGQVTSVTFDDGAEGWSGPQGPGGTSGVVPTGGNPGANLRTVFNNFGITFINSTNPAFVGDYTAAEEMTIAVDIRVDEIAFFGQNVSRPWLVEIRDYDGATGGYPWNSVWFKFANISAAANGNWITYSVTFDPRSTSLPPGWGGTGAEDPTTYDPILPPGVTFADVLAGVDAITFTTLEPGYFFGFTDFDLRLDNITIERTAAAPADLNGDGVVDGADLAILLAAWGPCPPKGSCQADFDGNGVVDGADLTTLLAAWG